MKTTSFLLPAAAALALGAGTARAQHTGHDMQGMEGMQHGAQHQMHPSTASAGIAEGTVKNGVRTVEISVTDAGFVPSQIKAKKGEKLRLVVTRKTDSTCAKEIVIKDAGINQPLPLEKTVTVELTPKKSGEMRYACGMDMIAGTIFIP